MAKHVGEPIADIVPLELTDTEWAQRDLVVQQLTSEQKAQDAAKGYQDALDRLASWGAPAKDIELVIKNKNLVRTPALQAVAALNQELLVVLSGGVGCGKTTAAVWWLWHGSHPRQTYVRVTDRRFMRASWFERHSRYDDKVISPLETSRALVVDDLGMEYADARGNFLADIDALLDARYSNLLPTVATTNLTADAFKERYGRRLRDRILGSGRFFNVNRPSLRPQGSA